MKRNLKILTMIALTLALVGLVRIGSQQARDESPRHERKSSAGRGSKVNAESRAERKFPSPEGSRAALQRYHALIETGRASPSEINACLEAMTFADLRELVHGWLVSPKDVIRCESSFPKYYALLAERRPEAVWNEMWDELEDLLSPPPRWNPQQKAYFLSKLRAAALEGWSKRDPEGAWKALLATESLNEDQFKLLAESHAISHRIIERMTQRDPALARATIRELNGRLRDNAMTGYALGLPASTNWASEVVRFEDLIDQRASISISAIEAQPRRMFAQRWMASDLSAALTWYVEALGTPPFAEDTNQEMRVQRSVDLLSAGLRDHRDEVLHWVRNQPWGWDYSDEIAARFILVDPHREDDIRPALLAMMRSEQSRFELLRLHVEGNPPGPLSRAYRVEFVRAILPRAKLSGEHEREIHGLIDRSLETAAN